MIPRLVAVGALSVGLLLALGLVLARPAPIAGTASPDPVAVQAVERPVVDTALVDRLFLRTVRDYRPSLAFVPDASLTGLASSTCAALNSGVSVERVLQVLSGAHDMETAQFLLGASVAAYCSQHVSLVLGR